MWLQPNGYGTDWQKMRSEEKRAAESREKGFRGFKTRKSLWLLLWMRRKSVDGCEHSGNMFWLKLRQM